MFIVSEGVHVQHVQVQMASCARMLRRMERNVATKLVQLPGLPGLTVYHGGGVVGMSACPRVTSTVKVMQGIGEFQWRINTCMFTAAARSSR